MSDFVHTTRCRVEDNGKGGRKLVPHNEKEMRWLLLRFEPGTEILLGAKQYRARHSPQSRGYLHGVVIPEILKAMGMEDSKENHQALYYKLKEKYGPTQVIVGKDDQELILPKSGSQYDKAEMSQLIDGAIRFAGEFLGLTIPPPDRTMSFDGGGI